MTTREASYQAYINEKTPNGNSRLDNIILALCADAKRERHVATQIDMAFQAGWIAALSTPATEPQGYVEGLERADTVTSPAPQPAADTRVWAVVALAEKPGSIGYRVVQIYGGNKNEAIGCGVLKIEELNPGFTIHSPDALAIIGKATTAPSDKIAEAALVLLGWWNTIDQDDPDMDVVLKIMGIMNSGDDGDRFDAVLRALAGKGE